MFYLLLAKSMFIIRMCRSIKLFCNRINFSHNEIFDDKNSAFSNAIHWLWRRVFSRFSSLSLRLVLGTTILCKMSGLSESLSVIFSGFSILFAPTFKSLFLSVT